MEMDWINVLLGFILGFLFGLLIVAIVAGSYENKLYKLCSKKQYDFCIEQKQWEVKVD